MLRNSVALCVLLAVYSSSVLAYMNVGGAGIGGLRGNSAIAGRNRPSVCGLEMRKARGGAFGKKNADLDDQDESSNGGDGPAVKKFGKLANVSRQKRGDIVGIRGSTKVQGKKWENLVAKPPTIRVTGGTAKGRKLSRPDVYLRPMMGKVKEALFSILREFDVLREDAVALDTFAGCGSVGIEALSQGIGGFLLARVEHQLVTNFSTISGQAVFIDYSKEACRVIEQNLEHCGFGERGFVVTSTAEKAYSEPGPLLNRVKRSGFDLVTITPPYEEVDYGVILNKVVTSEELLRDGAVVVVEYPVELGSLPPVLGTNLIGMRNRKYGRTVLAIYCLNPGVDLIPRPDEFGELRDTYLEKEK